MSAITFTTTIEILGVNPYVLVTKEQADSLQTGWRKPMPVLVQVNKQPETPWPINMMPTGDGSYYLYLHGDVRKASSSQVGDTVDVYVQFDEAYQNGPQHDMPGWFEQPLHEDSKALKAWEALPQSRQKEILRYFSSLKSIDAKERNLEKAMFVLSGNEGRFMARDWKNGQ